VGNLCAPELEIRYFQKITPRIKIVIVPEDLFRLMVGILEYSREWLIMEGNINTEHRPMHYNCKHKLFPFPVVHLSDIEGLTVVKKSTVLF
jgi:hypothetical protein